MTEKEKESKKSFLSGTWSQISDLILDLRNEPYIDEQELLEWMEYIEDTRQQRKVRHTLKVSR